MVDAIAVHFRANPEVIPVRRINHIAILQLWVTAGQAPDDVVRVNGSHFIVNRDFCTQAQRHRVEIAACRRGRQFGEIKAGGAQEFAGGVLCHPAFQRKAIHVFIGAFEIELFRAPAIAHDFPGISGAISLVHDEAAGCAQFRGLFEFIGPSSVIRHGLTAKRLGIKLRGILRIGHRRVVDQHDKDFAAHIHAFEVVPIEFGGLHSVTGKDHVCVDGGCIHHALGPGHEVIGELWH